MSEKINLDSFKFLDDDPLRDLTEEFKYEGKKIGALEVVIVNDMNAGEHYPVFIMPSEDRRLKLKEYENPADGQRIVQIIKL